MRRAGQLALMQRLAASPSSRTTLLLADRAKRRHAEGLAVRALGGDADHFGNHVAGAFHHHFVADLQAEAFDLVLIVERGARDGDAADLDGLEVGHRREGSGAAHLDLNALHGGDGLARGVLVGDGPAGCLGGEAEPALLIHGIDLDDDAIDFVRQFSRLAFPVGAEGHHFVDGVAELDLRLTLKPIWRSSSSDSQWLSKAGRPSVSRK